MFGFGNNGSTFSLLVSEVGGPLPADRWSQCKSFCENMFPQAPEGSEKTLIIQGILWLPKWH